MVYRRDISILDAKPGMILAKSIYSRKGGLLILEKTILNDTLIRMLRSNLVYSFVIEITREEEPDTVNTEENFILLQRKQEIHKLEGKYSEAVNSCADSLNNIIFKSKDVDSDALLSEFDQLLDNKVSDGQMLSIVHRLNDCSDGIYTHSVNVALISNIIGKWMNLSHERIDLLTISGLLHDIGKIQITKDILNNRLPLTVGEKHILERHPLTGYNLVKNQPIDQRIKNAILMHHERVDGSGYPLRIKMNDISTEAKIIAIADTYDRITSDRRTEHINNPFDVASIFDEVAFLQFDPDIIETFLDNMLYYYVGSFVKLSDGKIGEVSFISKQHLSKPIVKVNGRCIDLFLKPDLFIVEIV